MPMKTKVRQAIFGPLALAAFVATAASCGGSSAPAMANGCPVLSSPQAAMAGDTWQSFAQGFFAANCTRCHSSTLTGSAARNGAPTGLDWDVEATVKAHLDEIRDAVGVGNFMPPDAPMPNCDERKRIVAWIDAKAP